ncbi:MAG: putative toxin-antitoxin system toxin component, PIN family [Acidobacteria bacterium]|nr:putative toxin-antitoxin system toxin component, PIN family [Acidobacteriota bacterium]
MASELLRAALDTNVIVSAAIKPVGLPAYAVAVGVDQKFLICYSEEILEEYREVLARGKFRLPPKAVGALIADIERSGQSFAPQGKLSVCPDPDDNKFLECAEEANAHYLVTGNRRHFPPRHCTTNVVTPHQFITILVSLGII